MAGRHRLTRRQRALAALALVLTALHLGLADSIANRLDLDLAHAPPPARLRALFVRELRPTEPPKLAAVAALPHGPRPLRLPAPKPAASAPEPAASAALAAASAPAPAASAAESVATAASASEPAASAASAPPAFEWPASTRLTFALEGWYRGKVEGSAQVEWVREGDHYQVHLDAIIGLPIAPLFIRRMTSDGTLGPDGLVPRRYDEETRRAFGEPRRVVLRLFPDAVWLADGQRRDAPPGVQDSASQFVQLTWLFRTQPQRLAVGQTIELPLALPRSLDSWTYEVVGTETLYPPFGPVETFHLVPRHLPRPGELSAEMWFAPTLDYLPVRIRIRQDAESWIDMTIKRAPLQADDAGDPYSRPEEGRAPR